MARTWGAVRTFAPMRITPPTSPRRTRPRSAGLGAVPSIPTTSRDPTSSASGVDVAAGAEAAHAARNASPGARSVRARRMAEVSQSLVDAPTRHAAREGRQMLGSSSSRTENGRRQSSSVFPSIVSRHS